MSDPETEGLERDLAPFEAAARAVLAELSLTEIPHRRVRPVSGSSTSLLLACRGQGTREYLLKYFIPPAEGVFYPAGIRFEDYARREAAFYRYLDTMDPDRRDVPAPRTVMIDTADPPGWILLQNVEIAIGPAEEVLGMELVFGLLRQLQRAPVDRLIGRRDFPLQRWDAPSYLERVRIMYDPVLFVIGERRWHRVENFLREALRWTEMRPRVLVHGDFTEQNILVDSEGKPHLIDFERVGVGSEDHDFAWFWIHSRRSQDWKARLLHGYLGERMGSDRIRSEWGIRSALVYLALRRLRFGYLTHGIDDPNLTPNLGLLDAALEGGDLLFPPLR